MKSGVTMVVDRLPQVLAGLQKIAQKDVLVGIPSDTGGGDRGQQDGSNLRTQSAGKHRAISDITNAEIGLFNEFGAPEANLPARPHLIPGVRGVKARVLSYLKRAADAALRGNQTESERMLHMAGITAMNAVKRKITTGPFEPLAASTIRRRQRRSAGSSYRRKGDSAANTRPLIDTGQYRQAITYVIRSL